RVFPADLSLFEDHFPGMPVVPGVLLTEMIGQTAALCIEAVENNPGKAMLAQVKNAGFRRWVRPNEVIDIRAEVKALRDTFATVQGRAEVDGALAADAELLLTFVPWSSVPGYRSDALERYRHDHGA